MNHRFGVVFVVFCFLLHFVVAYKPVLFMHGLLGAPADFKEIVQWVTAAHPGQVTVVLDIDNNVDSQKPMNKQVADLATLVKNVTSGNSYADGFHFVGHSQGGLLGRSIFMMNQFNVDTFVSMAGVQFGVYGRYIIGSLFPGLGEGALTDVFYTKLQQDTYSVANWWHSPDHKRYVSNCVFLPVLNNETNNPNSAVWKQNLLRLKKFVLIGSPKDGIVTPWQSTLFGFYDQNQNIVSMQQQEVYINDVFGLKTLDQSGRLIVETAPAVQHLEWLTSKDAFQQYVMPHLT